MVNKEHHTKEGVPVPNVGILYWRQLPNETGFGLAILFSEDDTEKGYGCIFRNVDIYTRQPDDQRGYLIDEERSFPQWLEQFVVDLQEWTRAELAILSYDRISFYSNGEVDLSENPDNEAIATFAYRTSNVVLIPTEVQGIPIRNYQVFIGSAAMHLADLAASSAESS